MHGASVQSEVDSVIRPGDVWWAVPDPSVGREQAGRRPVVIVANEGYLAAVMTMVLAVPVTSRGRGWANHVELSPSTGLGSTSFAMTEQVRTISRERLVKHIGVVAPEEVALIRQWIADFLAA